MENGAATWWPVVDLKSVVVLQDEAVQRSVRCLESQSISDVYTLSLLAYTYTLMDRAAPRRQRVMDTLERLAINEGSSFVLYSPVRWDVLVWHEGYTL